MEVKTNVEEKRVKSTIIRRRQVAKPELAKVEEQPVELAPKQAVAETSVPAASGEEKGAAPKGAEGGVPAVPKVEEEKEVKPKKVARRKTKDELEMEMIDRAGGLKKVADIIELIPERLERVFRPERSTKKKKVLTHKEFKKTELTTPKAIKKVIRIENQVMVSELAHRMGIKSGEVVKKLMDLGVMATLNQIIDCDTAVLIAHDFGYEVENVAFEEGTILQQKPEGKNPVPRPPVVTIMGHVDHGKTTLLDTIRKAQVAAGEAGGITQHIWAYQDRLPKGMITFLDTPGHEAFTAIRARGAKVTDLVILVVAADDGVMPQTIEAINHAKAAKVPIVVAINKMDKPDADPARVERSLMEHGLISEKLGGETMFVPVSAKTGQGLEELLEMVLLQSEVADLKADPQIRAHGVVIEAKLDRGRGPVATVIVQEGTLRVGDPLVAGSAWGKVRALINEAGASIREATPSQPVEILGLNPLPDAGDPFDVTQSEEDAEKVSEHRTVKGREGREIARPRLEDLYAEARKDQVPELRLVIKADVHGSGEAIRDAIQKLSGEKVKVLIVHWGVGAITESDVMLALTSKAVMIGFNVRPDSKGREIAEREKVQIRQYSIIYEVLEDIRKAMEGLLKPIRKEEYLGRAEVRQLFKVSKIGMVAGCSVVDGKIARAAQARLLRDGKVVFEGKLGSLKRFKDDAREVAAGMECGIGFENFNDLKEGDVIESYAVEEIAQKL